MKTRINLKENGQESIYTQVGKPSYGSEVNHVINIVIGDVGVLGLTVLQAKQLRDGLNTNLRAVMGGDY
jgi:hypothetical protein